MKIVNLGSLNVDHVYRVDRFLLPGETKASKGLNDNAGGKGLNQSIAAARTGLRSTTPAISARAARCCAGCSPRRGSIWTGWRTTWISPAAIR